MSALIKTTLLAFSSDLIASRIFFIRSIVVTFYEYSIPHTAYIGKTLFVSVHFVQLNKVKLYVLIISEVCTFRCIVISPFDSFRISLCYLLVRNRWLNTNAVAFICHITSTHQIKICSIPNIHSRISF